MEVPAYIWIDNVEFNVAGDEQGTASHKITDVWITVDGQSIGLYQFPTRIPVLANGKTRLIIEAGIMDGGVAAKRRKYPFYKIFSMDANFKKGGIDTILPKFTYADYTNFYFIEDFEKAGIHFAAKDSIGAPLEKTNDKLLVFNHLKAVI
jgi:hypothetical protein